MPTATSSTTRPSSTQPGAGHLPEIGDRQGEGSHLGNLGIAYGSLGQYDKAIEHHNQALAISREIETGKARATAWATSAAYDSQYDKAIEHYNQALAISREIGDRQGEGSRPATRQRLRNLGQYDKAIDTTTRRWPSPARSETGKARAALGNLGIAYHNLGCTTRPSSTTTRRWPSPAKSETGEARQRLQPRQYLPKRPRRPHLGAGTPRRRGGRVRRDRE